MRYDTPRTIVADAIKKLSHQLEHLERKPPDNVTPLRPKKVTHVEIEGPPPAQAVRNSDVC